MSQSKQTITRVRTPTHEQVAAQRRLSSADAAATMGGYAPTACVILSAGHRNNTGGGAAGERERTHLFARAYRDVLRSAGYRVYYVQELDADADPDWFSGYLSAVTTKIRTIAESKPGERLVMLDLHLEEGPAPRGVFTIVPDDPTDRSDDVWSKNGQAIRLGGLISEAIARRTSLVIRKARLPGVMSERQTGVGEKKMRLGMFRGTAMLRTRMVRLIIEHGNVVKDRAIIDRPHTPARCASGVTEALARYFGEVSN